MGEKEGDASDPSSAARCHISRKVCYAFVFLAVASCVAVGVLVYFLATPDCVAIDDGGKGGKEGAKDGKEGDVEKKKKVTDVLLPRHLVPEHYRLQLVPFIVPDNYTIRGHVEITMRCVEPGGDNVTLHVAELTLDNDTIVVTEKGDGKAKMAIAEHVYDADREFYTARLKEALKPGKTYIMRIGFVAIIRDNLRGFYKSVYQDENGKNKTIAVTQFQATDARRAFPCFDEPALKAKFEVSLGRIRSMSSISNMPIKQAGVPMKDSSEYVWDHYEVSVPMSTYLVAFVVSDFEYQLAPPTGNNIEFRIWARKNALDQIDYAKSIGAKMLRHFEEYFAVEYPLPKQDMIAVPDFSSGAMENWGLITYRENALLYKPGVSSTSNKQWIAIVISHELAHQWFGNLVTPAWWTDLWLNEGFASYVEYLGVEAVQPEMRLLEQFVSLDLQSVMRVDSLESSHPISIPVNHPDEIAEIFDSISYIKGASIIRMMDHFLTTESFRKGLTNYLIAFKFKAATQDDLWSHLTQQAHKDGTLPKDLTVKTIMDTWTLQMGFPVVTVNRNYNQKSAIISQERFLSVMPDKPGDDKHNYQWWVPITFTSPGKTFNKTYSDIWLKPDEGEKTITGLPDKSKPVIFNVQETGYYRVNYDKQNWELLMQQLNANHGLVSTVNRAQIVDDAFNLAKAGLLDYKTALGLTEYLEKEREYIVWNAVLAAMGYVDDMLERSPAYGEFQKYMRTLIRPIFNHVGYEIRPEDHPLDIYLRAKVVGWACQLGMDECIGKVRGDFKRWMDQLNPDLEGANPIDVNMRKMVFCNAIRHGGEAEWDFVWQRYRRSNVGSEKDSLLQALCCSRDIWLLNRYLNMSLSPDSGIRQQDATAVISSIAGNVVGRDIAFDFVRDKWQNVLKYYAGSSFAIAGIMKNVMKNRNTRFDIDELIRFQEENKNTLSSSEREVRQAIEAGENNLKWMDGNYEIVFAWLKAQNSVKRF